MSTAAAPPITNTNQACCSIPSVQSDYSPKGTYKPYGDFQKVYVTGADRSEKAIICVFDIFGFFPQTQQGADILADTLKATVYMPDFFGEGKAFPTDKHPPKSDQDQADLQAFFGGIANPAKTTEKVIKFGEVLKKDGAKHVGVYGFCWGGKVTFGVGSHSDIFDSIAIVHPAMLSVDDTKDLKVPLGMYISKDEPKDQYDKIVEALSKKPRAEKNDSKVYSTMFHGWAAARADLKNEENKKEFEDVYGRLADFFNKTLTIIL